MLFLVDAENCASFVAPLEGTTLTTWLRRTMQTSARPLTLQSRSTTASISVRSIAECRHSTSG
jgi:hypothetical protein